MSGWGHKPKSRPSVVMSAWPLTADTCSSNGRISSLGRAAARTNGWPSASAAPGSFQLTTRHAPRGELREAGKIGPTALRRRARPCRAVEAGPRSRPSPRTFNWTTTGKIREGTTMFPRRSIPRKSELSAVRTERGCADARRRSKGRQ